MAGKGIEVSSDHIVTELAAIRERIAALETIASISNKAVVEAYVRGCVKTSQARSVLRACEKPSTREELISSLGFASRQALDHHLKPLKEDDLLQEDQSSGRSTFQWSNLFRRLPKKTITAILDESSPESVRKTKRT